MVKNTKIISKMSIDERELKSTTTTNPVVLGGLEQIGLKRIAPIEIPKYLLMHPALPRGIELKANRMIKLVDEDLLGNIFSIVVLIGMLGTVAYVGLGLKNNQPQKQTQFPNWLIPILSVIGLGVAGYLAYVEFTQVEAVCGPVGNCNTVQQSAYATLFGVIPIGFLGILGYLAILILWLLGTLEIPIWQKRIKAAQEKAAKEEAEEEARLQKEFDDMSSGF